MGRSTTANRETILEALCWYSQEIGMSYGKLVGTLSPGKIEDIYQEYLEICQQRREQERLRLEKAAKGKKT